MREGGKGEGEVEGIKVTGLDRELCKEGQRTSRCSGPRRVWLVRLGPGRDRTGKRIK